MIIEDPTMPNMHCHGGSAKLIRIAIENVGQICSNGITPVLENRSADQYCDPLNPTNCQTP